MERDRKRGIDTLKQNKPQYIVSREDLAKTNEDLLGKAAEVERRLKALKARNDRAGRRVARSICTLTTLERSLISDADPDQEAYFSYLDDKGLPAKRGETPDSLLRRAAGICRRNHFTAGDVSLVIVFRKASTVPSLNLGSIPGISVEDAVSRLSEEIVEYY